MRRIQPGIGLHFPTRQIFHPASPGKSTRRILHSQVHGRGVEQSQLRQLPVQRKVTRARPATHQKSMLRKMRVQKPQQAHIARFNQRRGGRVGTDDRETGNLPLRKKGFACGKHFFIHLHTAPMQRNGFTGAVYVGRVMPAVMEHGLGEPLIGEVFQQCIDKGEHGILWPGCTAKHITLKAA